MQERKNTQILTQEEVESYLNLVEALFLKVALVSKENNLIMSLAKTHPQLLMKRTVLTS